METEDILLALNIIEDKKMEFLTIGNKDVSSLIEKYL